MKSNYERPEVLELGEAKALIQGSKIFEQGAFDNLLGEDWRELPNDIDEGDE